MYIYDWGATWITLLLHRCIYTIEEQLESHCSYTAVYIYDWGATWIAQLLQRCVYMIEEQLESHCSYTAVYTWLRSNLNRTALTPLYINDWGATWTTLLLLFILIGPISSTGTCFKFQINGTYFEYWYMFQVSDLWHLIWVLVHVWSLRLIAPISSTGTCFKFQTYST